MTTGQGTENREYVRRALEIAVHVGLLILLATACLEILKPFLPLLAWGIIIAIAIYPRFSKLVKMMGGRDTLAAAVTTLILLAVLITPVVLMGGTLVEAVQTLAARLKAGTSIIPPPPERIAGWPIIGGPLSEAWSLASTNLTSALKLYGPHLTPVIPGVLSASAGVGLEVVQWVLSVLVAGALLAGADAGAEFSHRLANRLFGEKGPEFEKLAGSTIRSVTNGIIGVAMIQTVVAGLGFLIFGLPGAGLWAILFLVSAVLQIGIVVLLPAVIYMFAIASTTKAILFAAWCAVVGLMDNVLKPLLLGRGVAVPIAVVFLGAIGGFVSLGIIGLFVGAIVLSVGYKLFLAWVEQPAEAAAE